MFQQWFSNLPIKQKLFSLNLGIMAIMSIISLVTLLLITFNITKTQHRDTTERLIISFFTNPSVLSDLESGSANIQNHMHWTQSIPEIKSAAILKDGQLISGFVHKRQKVIPLDSYDTLVDKALIMPLNDSHPKLTFALNYRPWFSNGLYMGLLIASILVTISAIVLMLFSRRVVKYSLLNPIQHLISIAELVISKEDFQTRAQKYNQDEIGILVDRFNEMLTRIETRDHQLHLEKTKAEKATKKAQKLTSQTSEANTRLEFEVHVRAKIEKKLTDFQSYLNSIMNSMPSALIALDENFFVTLWNKQATQLSGTELESALGYSIEEAFPMLSDHLEEISHSLIEQEQKIIESVKFSIGNETLLLDLMIYPLVKTETPGAVIRIDDVTQKNRMEEVMVQTEKMMSVGGLAAGMAHEINNPLSAIIQGVQNIERRLSLELEPNRLEAEALQIDLKDINTYLENRRINKFLLNIRKAGERAADIVTNMLQFSRQTDRILVYENMGTVVNQAIDIVSNEQFLTLGETEQPLTITRDIEPSSGTVACMRQEVEQVLINLIKNGAQAIDKRLSNALNPFKPSINVKVSYDDSFCHIQVADNGTGMEEDIRKRVFEPFFTTKEVGVGTGLGLSVSYFIITSHHQGQMEVESTPGEGTRFTIQLPLALNNG